MNKLLLITILLIIFTGCHENQQWMSKEKSTARKSVLEMTTRSYTAGSSVFTEILPEGSEIGLFITYGNQDSLYKGASLYKNVKSKAVGSSKGSLGEFYQFNLSSCIRQQNSLTAQFVSFSLSNLANIFYPPQFLQ